MSAPGGISASVGRGGANRISDVKLVQTLLNKNLNKLAPGAKALAVDGLVGAKTIAAIEDYQRRVVKFNTPDGRLDPNGKTIQSLLGIRPRVAVAIHGWQGKHPTRGFELCAQTVAQSFSKATSLVRHAATKQQFVNVLQEADSKGDLSELHVYSHFGMDGPIFSDGQFMPNELEAGKLPAVRWAEGAEASFYGCNAGLSPWIVTFCQTQRVTSRGSAGFSLFSQRRYEFYPFDDDPDRTPCYLDCFPGMTDLLVQRYGYTAPDNFLDNLWRLARTWPEWRAARAKHLPPREMRVFKPQ